MYSYVVFARINVRSMPDAHVESSLWFGRLGELLATQRSVWVWDELRPYSGEAWLIEAGPDETGVPELGLPPQPSRVLGALRPSSSPGEAIAFALDLQRRSLALAPPEPVDAPELARRVESAFDSVGHRVLRAPDEVSFEVDLVSSRERLREWLRAHPDVHEMTVWVRHRNPGLDLDEDRAKMVLLRARRMQETMEAWPNRTLAIDPEEAAAQLGEEIEQGNADVVLKAAPPEAPEVFDSRMAPETEQLVDALGDVGDAIRAAASALARRVLRA